MSFVAKILGSRKAESDQARNESTAGSSALADGALDTLGALVRAMGDESFPLDDGINSYGFPITCAELAAHVENGAAVPSLEIPATTDRTRQWSRMRRFLIDHRRAEKAFVTERLQDYRGIVQDLAGGFRQIVERGEHTQNSVENSLNTIEEAVSTGELTIIRNALSKTVQKVTETFEVQRKEYEQQLQELNDRMSSLRQDLVAAHEEMQRDALTDAFNRGAFDSAIAHSLNMHFVLNQPVTLIMIDLDNFKQVNDTYGHTEGDRVLRAVGECLARSFIRKNDIVARYGGDEFAVILNDTTAQLTGRLVDRFLKSVGEIQLENAAENTRVGCSAGFTEIHSSDTIKTLIDRADRALYQAKKAGRNRHQCLMHPDEAAAEPSPDRAENSRH